MTFIIPNHNNLISLSIKSLKYASDVLEEEESNNNPPRGRAQINDREFEMEEEASNAPRRRRST